MSDNINIGQLSEAINEKMDRDLLNTDSVGQAILDKKVEVEALLAQNGYAKFSWNDGNKIASLIIQWLNVQMINSSAQTVTFPTVYTQGYNTAGIPVASSGTGLTQSTLVLLTQKSDLTKVSVILGGGSAEWYCSLIIIGA